MSRWCGEKYFDKIQPCTILSSYVLDPFPDQSIVNPTVWTTLTIIKSYLGLYTMFLDQTSTKYKKCPTDPHKEL